MDYKSFIHRLSLIYILTSQIRKGIFGRYIYKYFEFNERNLKVLNDSSLWFSEFEDFEDTLEGIIIPPYDYIRGLLGHICDNEGPIDDALIKELGEAYISVLKELQQGYVMCSFGRSYNNLHLWEKYRGFCLAFDVLTDPDYFDCLLPMQYEKEFSETDLANAPERALPQLFQRKSSSYIDEDEIRLYKYGERGPYPYKKQALRCVYFDERAQPELIEQVISILGESVTYYRVHIDTLSGKLTISLYDA